MSRLFRFRSTYFFLTLLLLGIEICIAIYVHDKFIRPYIGDLLVVILVYCALRSIFNIRMMPALVSALLFSYLVEFLQYIELLRLLGLQQSNLTRIILGTSFAWEDMIAYTAGALLVLLAERKNSISA